MSRPHPLTVWLGVVVLLLGALARIGFFNHSPPGMQHDEVFKAVEGVALARYGDFRVFYPTNQGHEGGYVWALAISQTLLGENLLGVRFPAMVFGLLAVALTYRLVGRVAGRQAGFVAAGMVAVSFWGAFVGRVGLRASMLPAFVALVGLGIWALTRPTAPRRPLFTAALTGLALGGSLYTYTSSFALFGGTAAVFIALLLTDRQTLWARWRSWAVLAAVAAVTAVPMVEARLTEPDGFNRASTITRPLTDALAGRPQELIDNGFGLVGMFAFTGDPEARYGLPGRPMFGAGVGLLVYLGAALMLWRVRRQPVYAYLLGVGLVGLIPSLLTVAAPSMLRSVAVLPVAAAAIGLSAGLMRGRLGMLTSGVLVSVVGIADLSALWLVWPRLPEVQAIYRDDLEQLAAAAPDGANRVFASKPDVELDALMFPFVRYRRPVEVAFFDGETTLPLTEGGLVYVSPLSPLNPALQPLLDGAQRLDRVLTQDGAVAYEVYQLDEVVLPPLPDAAYLWRGDVPYPRGAVAEWAEPLAYPIDFGGVLTLVGVELSDRVIAPQFDGVNINLYFRPQARQASDFRAFVHVYRRDGTLHAQRDLMGMPSTQWVQGTTIVQDNFVIMGESQSGRYVVVVGFYDARTGQRLPVLGADGAVLGDTVLVGQVRVGE